MPLRATTLLFCVLLACGDSAGGGGTAGTSSAGTSGGHAGTTDTSHAGASGIDGAVSGSGASGDGSSGTGATSDAGADGTCAGDIVIATSADLGAFAHCTRLAGSLTLQTTELVEVSLPMLERVEGSVRIGQLTSLTSASFPALTTVTGTFSLDVNKTLATLDLSALESVDELSLRNTFSLETLDLSALRSVGALGFSAIGIAEWVNDTITHLRALRIGESGALLKVRMSALASTDGQLIIDENHKLAVIELPALETVGGLCSVSNNWPLKTLELPKLKQVAGDHFEISSSRELTLLALPLLHGVGGWLFSDNDAISTLTLPALEEISEWFEIRGNSALSTLSMPLLKTGQGPIRIEDNPALPTCQAQALVEQLSGVTRTITVAGNDDAASCP
jgi:hypothetical protein